MRSALRLSTTGAALAAAAAATVALATPALADDSIGVRYDAAGSTVIAKPNSTVKLGPTQLNVRIQPDGSFSGSLPIPDTQAAFNVAGFLPAKATVSFIPVGAVTGKLATNSAGTSTVTATAKYTIKLTNVTLGGVPTFVGNSCQTLTPVVIPVATPAGQGFNIVTGGTVAGTYTIGLFGNCGLTTGIINALVPGPNNKVTFQLSNGTFTD